MIKASLCFAFLMSPLLSVCQTITYRPGTDVDFYSIYSSPVLAGCGSGKYVASGPPGMLPDYYDAAGTSTADSFQLILTPTDPPTSQSQWQARIIQGFPHTSGSHQSIHFVVVSKGFVSHDHLSLTQLGIWYSINGGTSWTILHQGGASGWGWTTDNISLTSNQDLSTVWVKVCDRVGGTGTAEVDLFVSDIRADVTN